jgi:hypothetical protein
MTTGGKIMLGLLGVGVVVGGVIIASRPKDWTYEVGLNDDGSAFFARVYVPGGGNYDISPFDSSESARTAAREYIFSQGGNPVLGASRG